MIQTLKIEVPEGKKAVWKDGKVVYEDLPPKLPDTWEEFCDSHFIYKEWLIGGDSSIIPIELKHRHPKVNRSVLSSKEAGDAHLALLQLHQLRDCYRQGWTPDWKDAESDKYCITYWGNPGEYEVYRYVVNSHFLSFQSQEIAEKFLRNFRKLIEQAGDLI